MACALLICDSRNEKGRDATLPLPQGRLPAYLAESLGAFSRCSRLSSLFSADCFAGGAIFAPDWVNAEFWAVGATPANAGKEITTGKMYAISFFMAGSVRSG